MDGANGRAAMKSRDGEGELGEGANLQRSREDGTVERREHEAGKQEGGCKRGGEREITKLRAVG